MYLINLIRKIININNNLFIFFCLIAIRESQRYFIPPVSSFLFLSFIVMMISFFGFQKIKKQKAEMAAKNSTNGTVHPNITAEIDEMKYEEVKKE